MTAAAAVSPWRDRLRGLDDIRPPVVVACSGGADSVALLALAVDAGLEPTAVYVDHRLRSGSDRDAAVVDAIATRLGACFDSRRVDVAAGANLEARAREARYAALEEARRDRGASAVLVGHTADDQAETVLLNLLRGSATTGLGGMPVRRGTVVRPLLGLRRAETVEICARLGYAPLRDPLNDDRSFRRVWLRREVVPMLERGANRDLSPLLARQAELLRADAELLDHLAAAAWPRGGRAGARELAALDPVLARHAVRRWLGAPPPAFDEVEAVLAVARNERRAVDLAGGRRVARTGGELRLESSPSAGPDVVPVTMPGRVERAGLWIESWIEHDAPARWPDGCWTCVVDAAAVESEGLLRRSRADGRWVLTEARSGDRVWTLGYGVERHARVTPQTEQYLWIAAGAL